jgi:hypothetical protein
MVIALLAGLGIGIKIGQHDKSNKAKPAAVVKKPKTSTTVRRAATGKRGPIVGTVVFKGPKLLIVKKKTGQVTLRLIAKTVVEQTMNGGPADIKAGAHVLFVLDSATTSPSTTTATTGPGPATAKEIVVVTGSRAARAGAVVASVTANSMTFDLGGRSVTVSTTGARILKTIPAKRSDLKGGTHVVMRSVLPPPLKTAKKAKKAAVVPRRRVALEIVILPVDTAFS